MSNYYIPTWKGLFDIISNLNINDDENIHALSIFLSEGKSLTKDMVKNLFSNFNINLNSENWLRTMVVNNYLEISNESYNCSEVPLSDGISFSLSSINNKIALVDDNGLILSYVGFNETDIEELVSVSADFSTVLERSLKRKQNILKGKHLFSFNGEDGLPLFSFFKFKIYNENFWLISEDELSLYHPAFIDFIWYLFYKTKPSHEVLIHSIEENKKLLNSKISSASRT